MGILQAVKDKMGENALQVYFSHFDLTWIFSLSHTLSLAHWQGLKAVTMGTQLTLLFAISPTDTREEDPVTKQQLLSPSP